MTARGPIKMPRRVASRIANEGLDVINQLIDARRAAGMTQTEVAEAMGISDTTVADMECGRHLNGPNITRVIKYARVVGLKSIRVAAEGEGAVDENPQSDTPVRSATLGIPCRAKTWAQCETNHANAQKIGCSFAATEWCDEDGTILGPGQGTPVCTRHRKMWASGRYYGVNPEQDQAAS